MRLQQPDRLRLLRQRLFGAPRLPQERRGLNVPADPVGLAAGPLGLQQGILGEPQRLVAVTLEPRESPALACDLGRQRGVVRRLGVSVGGLQ